MEKKGLKPSPRAPKEMLLRRLYFDLTGLPPSISEIDEVHQYIKNINDKFMNFKVIYGGSVNSSNSANINNLNNVDGCLIGGSSLKVDEFNRIIS